MSRVASAGMKGRTLGFARPGVRRTILGSEQVHAGDAAEQRD